MIENIIREEIENLDAIERLKSKEVVYMELKESQFACEFCIFIKDGICTNKKILAKVNPKKGCCNLYLPTRKDEVSPEDWQVNKK